jgi:hypothetical protein
MLYFSDTGMWDVSTSLLKGHLELQELSLPLDAKSFELSY